MCESKTLFTPTFTLLNPCFAGSAVGGIQQGEPSPVKGEEKKGFSGWIRVNQNALHQLLLLIRICYRELQQFYDLMNVSLFTRTALNPVTIALGFNGIFFMSCFSLVYCLCFTVLGVPREYAVLVLHKSILKLRKT